MRLLVIGDLHLGRDQWQPEIPEVWNTYDGILIVGDVADTQARSRAVVRDFYTAIGNLDPLGISIPGNHDYPLHTNALDGISGVVNGHAERIAIGDATVGGLGSTVFDEGPEVRGQLLRDHSPEPSLVDQLANAAAGTSNKASFTANAIEWYQERRDKLAELHLETADPPRILLTHVPAYGTSVAKLDSHPQYSTTISWGSLAVRRFLDGADLTLHICGHIHDQAGQDRVGKTITLNAGHRQAFAVEVAATGVESASPVSIPTR